MENEKVLELLCSLVNKKEVTTKTDMVSVPFAVGESYFFRTVTYHCTGRVKSIVGKFLVLEDAAWIAESGRFRQAIMEGVLIEVEPTDNDMYVNIDSIVDAHPWKNKLPRKQK